MWGGGGRLRTRIVLIEGYLHGVLSRPLSYVVAACPAEHG